MGALRVEKLNYFYVDGSGKREILKDINYEFELGKMYSIAGSSGSGKTTFLSLIAGLDTPKGGKVFYEEEDIKKIGLTKYRNKNIGIVFQQYNLVEYLNAYDNVIIALDIYGFKGDKKAKAIELLEKVGIAEDKIKRAITKLSGGEMQRVAIARALATNPEIILADEPTGNLDNKTQDEIIGIFDKLAKEENRCIIIVTHDLEVEERSDINIKLIDGKFITS